MVILNAFNRKTNEIVAKVYGFTLQSCINSADNLYYNDSDIDYAAFKPNSLIGILKLKESKDIKIMEAI